MSSGSYKTPRSTSRSRSKSYHSAKSKTSQNRFPVAHRTIGTLASYLNGPTYRNLSRTSRTTKHILNGMKRPLPALLQEKKHQLKPVFRPLTRTHKKRTNASYKNMYQSNLGRYNHLNSARRT